MIDVSVPHNGWLPRPHQLPLWTYLQSGGDRAVAIWHRRAGKDEVCLHHTAVAAFKRVANFWHCLPEYAMARKAIWDAVNPHTGARRIDEAFPLPLRESTRDHDMTIKFINGSTWSCIGSDSYDRVVGSSAAGVVFSEYALCNPSAWAYMAPMLTENNGWAVFISTPRGHNHAKTMYDHAAQHPRWFAERLTATDTGVMTQEALDDARAEMTALYGFDHGNAQFRQEYLVDWSSALLGSFYAHEMAQVRDEGRIMECEALSDRPVHTCWDLGVGDDTSIWMYQAQGAQLVVLDHYAASGVGVEHYRDELFKRFRDRNWIRGDDWVPFDAKIKEWGSGRTRVETMQALGLNPILVPHATIDDGINAVRRTLPLCVFHPRTEATGIAALEQYRREWDDDKKAFRASAVHDWTSHPCFTGDTQVLTRHGTYRIDELPQTGEVLTPCGWKQYHSPRITQRNAQLVEVVFTDGLSVRCTPEHLFKTTSGWKSAASLTSIMQIQSSLTFSRSISMAASTACGRVKSIFLAAARSCIAMLGRGHSDLSLAGVTSIIGTPIQPTTRSTIWNASPQGSTWLSRLKTAGKAATRVGGSPTRQGMQPLTGIGQTKGVYGINGTPNDQRAGSNGNARKSLARSAVSCSMLSFARAAIRRFTAILTARPLRIERVERLDQREDVYCLTVPGEQSFSLVNGAVVHNCDAFRYLAMSWKPAPLRVVKPPPQTGWRIPPPPERRSARL